jgi:hypothetical protein
MQMIFRKRGSMLVKIRLFFLIEFIGDLFQAFNHSVSIPDVSAKPTTPHKLPKNKRRRQRRDTLPNTKPV